MMLALIILVVHADAFQKNKFDTILSYALAEMKQFGRGAGTARRELLQTAKVLEVSTLAPLCHYGLISQAAEQ